MAIKTQFGLLLGTEAPIMTPGGAELTFLFFFSDHGMQ